MRVAFVHPRYPSAEGTGATHSATQIVSGLVESGHEVCVYCPEWPDESPSVDGVEMRALTGTSSHPHTDTRRNNEIKARRDEFREFDVLHSYQMALTPAIARVGRESDVATVVTLNAYGGVCPKNDLRHLDREPCREKSTAKCLSCIGRTSFGGQQGYLYETASRLLSLRLIGRGERRLGGIDGFQALSPHVRDIYAGFGYDREKIRVIPNILDTRFEVEHETGFEPPYRLLSVGSLQHSKGVDRLPEIVSRLSARVDAAVSLTVVGEGDLRPTVERVVAERDLSNRVTFTGRVPYEELPETYASHDLFLYPGRWDEPFGRVFIEAMATGTPVVSTDVGSVADIVGDAGVVTEQSVDALVDGLASVLDPATLREHSAAGRERRHRYTAETVIPAFEDLYADVSK